MRIINYSSNTTVRNCRKENTDGMRGRLGEVGWER